MKGKTRPQDRKSQNKLISIRISDETIQRLRQVAEEKGDLGYQQLMKSYIHTGLTQEMSEPISEKTNGTIATQDVPVKPPVSPNPTNHGSPVHGTQTKEMPIQNIPQVKSKKRDGITELSTSKTIAEDIQRLASNLEAYYEFFAGKTFLITGAFGFLGRYMVYLLKYLNEKILTKKAQGLLIDNFVTGYEQGVISDENLIFRHHDVSKPLILEGAIDYLIHAAGIASPVYYTKYPIETMDVGTLGTRNMLELARMKNVKSFLFASSSEVYGDPDPKHVPTKENYPGNVPILGPRSCYDESKRFGETMCLTFWRIFNLPVKIVRPFNVYGPGIRPDDYRVLPNFIEHALRKEPLPVHGEGKNTRSFCYINDAIRAIFKILFSEANGEAFNVGNPEPEISVKDLALKVAKSMPHKVNIVHIDAPHAVYATADPKRRCPDISKLEFMTGFQTEYTLEEGLERTINWFREL